MRRLLALGVLPLLLLCAPAAQGSFAPQSETIFSGKEITAEHALDARGDALVAWAERSAPSEPFLTKARWLSTSGQLGPVLDLKPGGPAAYPAVGVGADGRGFVAWRSFVGFEPSTVEGRWVGRDGTLGPILTLAVPSPGSELEPVELNVVVDSSGVASIGWRNDNPNTISLRRVYPDSSLSPLLSDVSGKNDANELRLAATPSGGTILVWGGIRMSYVAPDLSYGASQVISTGSTAWPEIATDAAGTSLVIWRAGTSENFRAAGRLLDPNGVPIGAELEIGPPENFVGVRPAVAAAGAGAFLTTWDGRQTSGGTFTAFARPVSGSGQFAAAPQPVSTGVEGDNTQPLAALFGSGTGLLVWSGNAPGPGGFSALGRTVDSLGTATGAVETLGTGAPQLASAAPLGYAVALMEDGETLTARRFLEPPSCAAATATLRSSKGVTVQLSCTGLGIRSGTAVKAPRFGTAGPLDPAGTSFLYKPEARSGGNDSFTYSVASEGGTAGAVEVTIADRLKPIVKKVRLVKKRGAFKLKVKASEPARFKVKAKGGGKAKSKRLSAKATIRLKGKLARRLAAGKRIRIKVTATDRAGNKSRAKKARISA